jgi:flagellum-specific peptidoglycan hydrolase FlgJ
LNTPLSRLTHRIASPLRARVLVGFALTSLVTPLAVMPMQPFAQLFAAVEPAKTEVRASTWRGDDRIVAFMTTAAAAEAAELEIAPEAEAPASEPILQVQPHAAHLHRAARNNEEAFIFGLVEGAQESQRETRVPASVTIAQGILESSWGRSGLSTKAHNYFGVKAQTKEGPAGVVYMDTWEVENGENVMRSEPFRSYHNAAESLIDHGRFFVENRRYAAALAVADDPRAFARQINIAGYATDPAYAPKLISLMDKYDLYQYDLV